MDPKPAPRCYILDESYRLILACVPSPDDPLYPLYDADSSPEALPAIVERSVRVLTARWGEMGRPREATTAVAGLRVTVAPLYGVGGRHIAVFIAADAADPPLRYAMSA
ncbi:MAG TPA: hypothetical protein VMH02_00960 [Verrucomicrobiae bacterium]|nr:hypothetical protein [Verrucomicrobiae bacterium]